MRITLSSSALSALALTGIVALTGCASTDEPGANPTSAPTSSTTVATSPSPSATAESQVVEITIKDGKVTPAGKTVEVEVGKPVELRVTSDVAAHLHVHSTPEQSIHAEPGTTTGTVTIERPGVVEVEVEDTGTLVVNLEAR